MEELMKQIEFLWLAVRGLSSSPEQMTLHTQMVDNLYLLERMMEVELPLNLVALMPLLRFEAQKRIMDIICVLLRQDIAKEMSAHLVVYIRNRPQFFDLLLDGCAHNETDVHSGVILRSCMRNNELVQAFLKHGGGFKLLDFIIKSQEADKALDLFTTLSCALLQCREAASSWLKANAQCFFGRLNCLLQRDFVLQRLVLSLLADVFLDKCFQVAMLGYVSKLENLKIVMELMRGGSLTVRLAAFRLFQLFVANPNKPEPVLRVLLNNRQRLVGLLGTMHISQPETEKETSLSNALTTCIAKLQALEARSTVESPRTHERL